MKKTKIASIDTPKDAANEAVISRNEKVTSDRLFYAETASGAEGNVSSVGQLIRKNATQIKDSALEYLSLRRAGLLAFIGSLKSATSFTAQDFKNLVVSAKTAFATASMTPIAAFSLTSNFSNMAVTTQAKQEIATQFNQLQTRIEIAQNPEFMGPMPSAGLEQLRHQPNNLNALKSAFSEAGFVYTGNNQPVCTPEKFEELVTKFGSVSNKPTSINQPTVLVAAFANQAQECGAVASTIQNVAQPVGQVALPELRNDQVA